MSNSPLYVGRRFWVDDAPRGARTYPRLTGRHDTEIAIVGGGMTGALAAHAFASAGVATTLLEAAHVGRGSTAASSALLLQEPDQELRRLAKQYGMATSRRMWELSRDSARELVSLLERLRISCGLQRRDSVYYAGRAEIDDLRREHALRRRLGFGATWLEPGALRRLTAITAPGAIRTTGGAQFDPYRACLGVAAAAARAGAGIFEQSPVRRITPTRDGVDVYTTGGVVSARRVIVATGYATEDFKPLAGRFEMYRTYVLVTEPVDAARRREIGLGDVMLWNAERPYHYARWTSDRRLLLGGSDRLVAPGQRRRQQLRTATAALRDYFEERLPGMIGVATANAWEGLFAVTPDSLPYVGPHRRYPHHWFALGYGGNGLTFAHLAARLLLERWQDRASRDHDLFAFDRMPRR